MFEERDEQIQVEKNARTWFLTHLLPAACLAGQEARGFLEPRLYFSPIFHCKTEALSKVWVCVHLWYL